VRLAIEQPTAKGELRIFNQFTETFSVNDLAARIQSVSNSLCMNVSVQPIENPRKEKEEHYYNPKHTGLLDLGLKPNFLTDDMLAQMMEYVRSHEKNIDSHKIFRGTRWR